MPGNTIQFFVGLFHKHFLNHTAYLSKSSVSNTGQLLVANQVHKLQVNGKTQDNISTTRVDQNRVLLHPRPTETEPELQKEPKWIYMYTTV